jgi:hypothetical protein
MCIHADGQDGSISPHKIQKQDWSGQGWQKHTLTGTRWKQVRRSEAERLKRGGVMNRASRKYRTMGNWCILDLKYKFTTIAVDVPATS